MVTINLLPLIFDTAQASMRVDVRETRPLPKRVDHHAFFTMPGAFMPCFIIQKFLACANSLLQPFFICSSSVTLKFGGAGYKPKLISLSF